MDDLITLEICANSVASAVAAQKGGAARVELCDNLAEGGTTPSYATIARTRDLLKIQVYPIIRPRGGDFLYDELEYELMWQDIGACKKLGCDGVVIGLLMADGTIDVRRTRLLAEWAWPMGVTFHRAFDRCRDPLVALEDIIKTGCERILTSGQKPLATEGAELLAQLVAEAGDRISIMVGSGVRSHNIATLVQQTRAREYHSTAQKKITGGMTFKNQLVTGREEEEQGLVVTDAGIVQELRLLAEKAWGESHV